MLHLVSARKTYRTGELALNVLAGIDLDIHDGEMLAVTGPSGTGKSTLLNILGCLDLLTAGEYWVDDLSTAGLGARALANLRNQTFGFVFQFFGLITEYTAVENVMLPLVYRSLPLRLARQQAEAALARVGMDGSTEKYPYQLSGGQQQRVAVARAVVGAPRVILADEPTGSLDAVARREVLGLLDELHGNGHTIIIVTHSSEVSERCPRQLRLVDGHILEDSGHVPRAPR